MSGNPRLEALRRLANDKGRKLTLDELNSK